jgi:hypothetical protein
MVTGPPLAVMSDADWQVCKKTRSHCLHGTSEGTGGAERGQESKPAFLLLGHTPGCLVVIGNVCANETNSPPGRWV